MAYGAFDGTRLVGFGVLAHQFREGAESVAARSHVCLQSVQTAGELGHAFLLLSEEARRRGAQFLYISSTETRSAVSFYQSQGSEMTGEVDEELYTKRAQKIFIW